MIKYYLIAELLIFKHRWQNISCFQYYDYYYYYYYYYYYHHHHYYCCCCCYRCRFLFNLPIFRDHSRLGWVPEDPKEELMGIASVRLVQAGCPSCHPTDSVGPCAEDKDGVTNNRAWYPGRTAFQLRAVIADINHHTTAQSRKWQRRQRLTGSGDIAARQRIRLLSVRNKKQQQETKRNRLGYIQSDAWRTRKPMRLLYGDCTLSSYIFILGGIHVLAADTYRHLFDRHRRYYNSPL